MGLCIQVGVLADLMETEPEDAGWLRDELSGVSQVLVANGFPSHEEPESLPPLMSRSPINGFPYSFLHYLRRVIALRLKDPEFLAEPLPVNVEPDDPAVEAELDLMRNHVICHSDAEGYYVPQDFEDILLDENEDAPGGGIIGSSHQVLRELVAVAPALGIRLDGVDLPFEEADRITEIIESESGLWIELVVWFDLYEAARLSVEHGTAIVFS